MLVSVNSWKLCFSLFLACVQFSSSFYLRIFGAQDCKEKRKLFIGNWPSANLEFFHLSLFVNSWDRKEQASIGDFL